MRHAWLFLVAGSIAGCAGGSDKRPAEDDTGGETLGSSSTNDTIDPTRFSTSVADDGDSSDATASGTGTATSTATGDDTVGTTGSESGASSAASSTTGPVGDGPTVTGVDPADGADAVDPGTSISVTFSGAMDPDSVVTNVGSSGCNVAIAVSANGFASCVAMDAQPLAHDGDTRFVLTPATPLLGGETYEVRVTPDATAADGTPLAATFTSDGFVTRYYHTITIDGIDDFSNGETLATSTLGHNAKVAWDDTFVYVGMDSPDVGSGNGAVWVVAYFGGDMGTTTGEQYNTQQPLLPFAAQWHLRWRADDMYTGVEAFDGAGWSDAPFTINPGDVYRGGNLVEMRIARANLGDPDILELHLGILREQEFDEASWAATPSSSYSDGYDPDYAAYYAFDLSASELPIQYDPSP